MRRNKIEPLWFKVSFICEGPFKGKFAVFKYLFGDIPKMRVLTYKELTKEIKDESIKHG